MLLEWSGIKVNYIGNIRNILFGIECLVKCMSIKLCRCNGFAFDFIVYFFIKIIRNSHDSDFLSAELVTKEENRKCLFTTSSSVTGILWHYFLSSNSLSIRITSIYIYTCIYCIFHVIMGKQSNVGVFVMFGLLKFYLN